MYPTETLSTASSTPNCFQPKLGYFLFSPISGYLTLMQAYVVSLQSPIYKDECILSRQYIWLVCPFLFLENYGMEEVKRLGRLGVDGLKGLSMSVLRSLA